MLWCRPARAPCGTYRQLYELWPFIAIGKTFFLSNLSPTISIVLNQTCRFLFVKNALNVSACLEMRSRGKKDRISDEKNFLTWLRFSWQTIFLSQNIHLQFTSCRTLRLRRIFCFFPETSWPRCSEGQTRIISKCQLSWSDNSHGKNTSYLNLFFRFISSRGH